MIIDFKGIFNKYFGEIVRFGIVGCASALFLYLVYYLLLFVINHTIAYSVGYFISFLLNYYLSVVYTFKVHSKAQNFLGFTLSHVVNFTLQILLLNIFIYFGISAKIAPIPVLAICIPTNFILVRYFLNK